jgi:hypothetical protein
MPDPYGRSGGGPAWEQPGLIPLRPMTIGDILGIGWAVLRRHLAPLAGAAVLVSAVSSVVTIATLWLFGSLGAFASSAWLQDILDGGTSIPSGILWGSLLGLLVSTAGAPIVAGLATAYTGADALGRDGNGAVAERLTGRWAVLLGICVVVGALVTVGLMVLVIPGIIAYLMLVLAGPATVMERGSVGESLRRSVALTRGHRGRILGAVAVTAIAGTLASAVMTTLVGGLAGATGSVSAFVLAQFVSVLVGGFFAGWTGAVVAVLYVDIRIRTEHLDQVLRIAAAADRARLNPPTPPGY